VKPADPPVGFHHEYKTVNGIKIHYVIGGKGQPLLLIHGFGQNWYMWNRLLPALSTHFTVIAPDLPGVGESGKPREGYDKKSLSADLHELIKRLGFKNINIAGHDIGMMVAYSYAAQYRSEVKKIALLDAVIPGVDPDWSHLYHTNWWFGFFARPIAGDIVSDHASEFLKDFWSLMAHRKEPFTSRESQEFIRAYSVPGAATGSFHWFGAFLQDAKDNQEFIKTKLTMPMLAVSGEFSAASYFTNHCKQVAGNVTGVIIHGSGHWLVQENTAEVLKAFIAFFGN
jgi:pimeloyl-ACP methyl ester carboxylesterase